MHSGPFLPAALIALVLASAAGLQAGDAPPAAASKQRIVVSGFDKFAGRPVNASGELARAIAERFPELNITFVEVPVLWGAPREIIAQQMKLKPALWIAFGEGRGQFRIETVALNERLPLPDNLLAAPAAPVIEPQGPARLELGGAPAELRDRIEKLGYPCVVSASAGRFLCEEMLYGLLQETKRPDTTLRGAMFIHVPVHGEKITVRGSEMAFSGDILKAAATDLFPAILNWLNTRVTSPAGKSGSR